MAPTDDEARAVRDYIDASPGAVRCRLVDAPAPLRVAIEMMMLEQATKRKTAN
jgi:hypothetical protein